MNESPSSTTLLLDIFQRMGHLEGQNELILQEQGRARADTIEIAKNVTDVAQKLSVANKRVDDMEPHVTKMVAFRLQMSVAVVFVTAVVTGAINVLWLAISHFHEIKTALRELMR